MPIPLVKSTTTQVSCQVKRIFSLVEKDIVAQNRKERMTKVNNFCVTCFYDSRPTKYSKNKNCQTKKTF